MLTSKQRAFLRSLGNDLEPIFQIGKNGLSEELMKQLSSALEARELIKVRVLKNCQQTPQAAAEQSAQALGAELVQVIGRNFILYREAREEPRLELP